MHPGLPTDEGFSATRGFQVQKQEMSAANRVLLVSLLILSTPTLIHSQMMLMLTKLSPDSRWTWASLLTDPANGLLQASFYHMSDKNNSKLAEIRGR